MICNLSDRINAGNAYSTNMAKTIDLVGKSFDRWTVIERADSDKYGIAIWKCTCKCGREGLVRGNALRRGASLSCGCITHEIITKHGMCESRPYRIWQGLKTRCTNPKQPNFERYGNRRIEYDIGWETFEGFWEDMSISYRDGLTIERIDNSKGYSKDNCRWVTPHEQNRNMRTNIFIEYKGTKYCLTDLALKINVPRRKLYYLHNKGYEEIDLVNQALRSI